MSHGIYLDKYNIMNTSSNTNHIMRKLIISIILIVSSFAVKASSVPKLQFGVDYHYNLGITQRLMGVTVNRGDLKMYGNSLHFSLLYNLSPRFTTGVGIGFDSYRPSANTLPVFATVRYRPIRNTKLKDIYCFSNLGYSIPDEDDDVLSSGFLFDLGLGWQRMLRRHFGLNLQVGYNLKEFRANKHSYNETSLEYETTKFNVLRNSLSFGIGLVF